MPSSTARRESPFFRPPRTGAPAQGLSAPCKHIDRTSVAGLQEFSAKLILCSAHRCGDMCEQSCCRYFRAESKLHQQPLEVTVPVSAVELLCDQCDAATKKLTYHSSSNKVRLDGPIYLPQALSDSFLNFWRYYASGRVGQACFTGALSGVQVTPDPP